VDQESGVAEVGKLVQIAKDAKADEALLLLPV